MRLARVFPRRTKATPDDDLTFVGMPSLPDLCVEADEVHVSVAFKYDKPFAEVAERWAAAGHRVRIGGVAYGDRGDEFVPGRYIKDGYVFTSRGCPRRCTFCSVWLRDPKPRLLPIVDGWNVLDDNLLATPRAHVEAVFAMLRRQRRRVEFTGGLEAKSLKDYQVDLLASLRPRPNMFWAYDPGDTFEVMQSAAQRLLAAGLGARQAVARVPAAVGAARHHPLDRRGYCIDGDGSIDADRQPARPDGSEHVIQPVTAVGSGREFGRLHLTRGGNSDGHGLDHQRGNRDVRHEDRGGSSSSGHGRTVVDRSTGRAARRDAGDRDCAAAGAGHARPVSGCAQARTRNRVRQRRRVVRMTPRLANAALVFWLCVCAVYFGFTIPAAQEWRDETVRAWVQWPRVPRCWKNGTTNWQPFMRCLERGIGR